MPIRRRSPHIPPEPSRPTRLAQEQRRQEGRQEREARTAVVCDCGEVLGLAGSGQALYCRACGTWIDADAGSPVSH